MAGHHANLASGAVYHGQACLASGASRERFLFTLTPVLSAVHWIRFQ